MPKSVGYTERTADVFSCRILYLTRAFTYVKCMLTAWSNGAHTHELIQKNQLNYLFAPNRKEISHNGKISY